MTDTSIPSADQSLDAETAPAAVADVDVDTEETEAEATREKKVPAESELFRQSEIAADYVEGLLDILDYDGDIDELVSGGRPVVEVVGSSLQNLVGQRGATLEALQELARLAVFRQTGVPSRLLLDVGGYRATRRKEARRSRQERGREGQGVRRAGAPRADVRVRAQVRARCGQRDERRGERVRGRRAEPAHHRPAGGLTG